MDDSLPKTHFFSCLRPEGTPEIPARRAQLLSLRRGIRSRERALITAVMRDLGKGYDEVFLSEFLPLAREVRHCLRGLGRWARPRPVPWDIAFVGSRAWIRPVPRGRVLIYAPWNYPLLLLLQPLVDALSAGNTAVISPSPSAPHTLEAVRELIHETLPHDVCEVLSPGQIDGDELLDLPFDMVFYTGGPDYARHIASRVGTRFIPQVYELGGKCPCVVGRGADLHLAAKRIAWGKLLNSGQTCVAPDYVLVQSDLEEDLIRLLTKEFTRQMEARHGDGMLPLIRPREAERARSYLQEGQIAYGGQISASSMQPTILRGVQMDGNVMRDELFLPILPILSYESLDEALEQIHRQGEPLAIYHFGKRHESRAIGRKTRSGSLIRNETVMQLGWTGLPFGGVGGSGTGRYHGRAGFEAFSHLRTEMKASRRIDFRWRYTLRVPKGLLRRIT